MLPPEQGATAGAEVRVRSSGVLMSLVVEIKEVENCIDSAVVKEFMLDCPLDEEIMRTMSAEAELKYYPDFPRPYFRIERKKAYVIQGILGNRMVRVTFSPSAGENEAEKLRNLIDHHQSN